MHCFALWSLWLQVLYSLYGSRPSPEEHNWLSAIIMKWLMHNMVHSVIQACMQSNDSPAWMLVEHYTWRRRLLKRNLVLVKYWETFHFFCCRVLNKPCSVLPSLVLYLMWMLTIIAYWWLLNFSASIFFVRAFIPCLISLSSTSFYFRPFMLLDLEFFFFYLNLALSTVVSILLNISLHFSL